MYRLSDIYLRIPDVLNDLFFIYRTEKTTSVWFFKKCNNYFFFTSTSTTSKLDDNIPVTHFWDFKYQYSKRYSQTTDKFDDSTMAAHFLGLWSNNGAWTTNKFDNSILVTDLYDFNNSIFGKEAPSSSFVENHNKTKLVLN